MGTRINRKLNSKGENMKYLLPILLLLFTSCTITTYQYPTDALIIEDYQPVRVLIYPTPRYRTPVYYHNYHWRTTMKTKTVRRHNGVRVHKKNYWSKTTKHPHKKHNNSERRHNWRHRKSLKDR